MESLQGNLLIAPPQEQDPDLASAVILLIQHSPQQAVGVVLNRPTSTTIREAWTGSGRCQRDECVYSGGPVPGPLMALHSDPEFSEIEVLAGVHYSVQIGRLQKLLRNPTAPFKVFESHIGWGPGQLEEFIAPGDWTIVPATAEQVFHPGPGLWEELSG